MTNTNKDENLNYLLLMINNSETYLPLIEGLIKRVRFHTESFIRIQNEYFDIHHTSVDKEKQNKENDALRQIDMSKKYIAQLLEEVSKLKSLAELQSKLIQDNMIYENKEIVIYKVELPESMKSQ